MSEEVLLAFSTFPDAEAAERIAEQLVTARLAACANIVGAPVRSIYHWAGKIERGEETLVLFKTTRSRFDEFRATLKSLHPYEVPEIISLSITDGLPEYLGWVAESCATPGAATTPDSG